MEVTIKNYLAGFHRGACGNEAKKLARLIFNSEQDKQAAAAVLDEIGIKYDLDGGDRMMVDNDEALNAICDADIDFDLI